MKHSEPLVAILRTHAGLQILVWSVILAAVSAWYVIDERAQLHRIVAVQAEAMLERDILYRQWSARHGGVYVAVGPELEPNPYLSRVFERDVITPSGRVLTLVNPDYLTRLVYALDGRDDVHSHLVSLEPIRAEDGPDAWERQGLLALQQGAPPQSAFVQMDGREVFRYLRPLVVEPECLGCHVEHGFKEGEVRGGLSFSVAVAPLLATQQRHVGAGLLGYGVVWGLGVGGILLLGQHLRRQMERVREHTEQLSVAELNIEQLTFYDPVTGLPNRLLFSERMRSALAAAERSNSRLTVGVVGIDHYKKLKNTFGLATGEELLRVVVRRLQGTLQADDILATLSDGRFLLLLPNVERAEQVGKFVQQVRQALAVPQMVGGHEFFLSASMGFALFPEDGGDEKSLVSAADAAFSRAKAQGRNSFELYTASLKERALEQITLENILRRALEREQLEVHYQPQVSARNGRIIGAEALLRWRNPELGIVSPAEFIPLAEESGMIFAIGQWVLNRACRDAADWIRKHGVEIAVSVNVSPRQFLQADLVAAVDEALAASGLAPVNLVLEITEGSIVEDVEKASAILGELKSRGVRIAIDDFGTGYSSLNYLKRFPVDMVKIDKSFVFDIHLRDNNNVIVSSIVAMARKMEMEVVAEGVETDAQRDFLLNLGCDTLQGFYYSRALGVERFNDLILALREESGDYYQWWSELGGSRVI